MTIILTGRVRPGRGDASQWLGRFNDAYSSTRTLMRSFSRSFSRPALLGVALATASCSATQEPTPCGASVDLVVDRGPEPVLAWTPACAVAQVGVTKVGGDVVWILGVASDRNTIASGVRYGERPAGTRHLVAPQPLEIGVQYDVQLIVAEPGPAGTVQLFGTGLRRFTVTP